MSSDQITVKYYSEISSKMVRFLWYPYIPFGKLTLIQGDPGEGKSSLILKIASELSMGGFIPDGSVLKKPLNVIYQCLEDDPEDTIKPRLECYGADMGHIAFIRNKDGLLSSFDRDTLIKVIKKSEAKLFILDPIQSFLTREVALNSAKSVRKYMNILVSAAESTGCAIVLVGHLNKNENGKNIYRGMGSIDIAAVCRSILQVEKLSDNSNVRIIRHVKSSLAPEGGTFGFEIADDRDIKWIGAINIDDEAGEIICQSGAGYNEKHKYVKKTLFRLLSEGDCSYKQIVRSLEGAVSIRTMNSIKKELGIVSVRKADGWYWHLPEGEADEE